MLAPEGQADAEARQGGGHDGHEGIEGVTQEIDIAQLPDKDVLRVADDGQATVVGHAKTKQEGDGVEPVSHEDGGKQRCEGKRDDGVVEEGGGDGADGHHHEQEQPGAVEESGQVFPDGGVKPGEMQLRGDEHQGKDERQRMKVDAADGLVEGQAAEGEHQEGPKQRKAGAVKPDALALPDGDPQVGAQENT